MKTRTRLYAHLRSDDRVVVRDVPLVCKFSQYSGRLVWEAACQPTYLIAVKPKPFTEIIR